MTSYTLLLVSVLALSIGPLLYRLFRQRKDVMRALDGFVTVGVGGLVLFHVLPPSIAMGGLTALVFLAAGMILPTAIERVQHGNIRTAHTAALVLAFLALAVHAMVDGVALSQVQSGGGEALPVALAVVLHRIPVGLAVWILLRPSQGTRIASGVLTLIVVGTLVGFFAGPAMMSSLEGATFGWFQAFVAGSLLHVVFHAHEHDHSHDHGDPHGHGHAHGHTHSHSGGHAHGDGHSGGHAPGHAQPSPSAPAGPTAMAVNAPVGGSLLRPARAGSARLSPPAPVARLGVFDAASLRLAAEPPSCCAVDEPWDEPNVPFAERVVRFLDVDAMRRQSAEVIGALCGVLVVLFMTWVERGAEVLDADPDEHEGHAHAAGAHDALADAASLVIQGHDGHSHSSLFTAEGLERLLHLALDSAPYLIAGYVLSALIFARVRPFSLAWLQRGPSALAALKGVVFGFVMPVRACGVVPVYESLSDRGAPASGAVSFLVATPQLRLETMLFSLPLLGLGMSLFRVGVVALLAFLMGCLAALLPRPAVLASDAHDVVVLSPLSAMRHGLGRLVDDTAPWIIIGLLVAVVVEPNSLTFFDQWPGWAEVLFFALLGIPVYICATGATPVAAALIFAGVSSGAAMVFLVSGPMASVAMLRVMRKRFGAKRAWAIMVVLYALVLGGGLWAQSMFPSSSASVLGLHDHPTGNLLQWVALWTIGVLFVWSLLRRGPRAWLNTIVAGDHG